MRSLLLSALLLSLLPACGGDNAHLTADGGHRPLSCREEDQIPVTVTVVDASGAPVQGAEVVARNVGSGVTQTSTTNAQGVTTAVTGELGEGTVRVTATSSSKQSEPAQLAFTCGECGCTGNPASVTLTLPQ